MPRRKKIDQGVENIKYVRRQIEEHQQRMKLMGGVGVAIAPPRLRCPYCGGETTEQGTMCCSTMANCVLAIFQRQDVENVQRAAEKHAWN